MKPQVIGVFRIDSEFQCLCKKKKKTGGNVVYLFELRSTYLTWMHLLFDSKTSASLCSEYYNNIYIYIFLQILGLDFYFGVKSNAPPLSLFVVHLQLDMNYYKNVLCVTW